MPLAFAFIAGLIAFIDPGVIATVPGYLAYLAAQPSRRAVAAAGQAVLAVGARPSVAVLEAEQKVPVGVDEGHHFGSRGWSSRAKKLAAALRISLARRSSRFSHSSLAVRRRSLLLMPGRWPPSISAFTAHVRSDSVPMLSWRASRVIIPKRSSVSSMLCRIMRTARSRARAGAASLRRVGTPGVDALSGMTPTFLPSAGASSRPRMIRSFRLSALAWHDRSAGGPPCLT